MFRAKLLENSLECTVQRHSRRLDDLLRIDASEDLVYLEDVASHQVDRNVRDLRSVGRDDALPAEREAALPEAGLPEAYVLERQEGHLDRQNVGAVAYERGDHWDGTERYYGRPIGSSQCRP